MPDTTARMPLMQELSVCHELAMQCAVRADRLLDGAGPADADQRAGLESVRMAVLAARLIEGVGEGIERLRWLAVVGPTSATDRVIGSDASAATGRPAAVVRQPRSAATARPKLHAAPGQRRGRLKNGNPAGDYLKSPRCGARTRVGCGCRQPAMANGRCRLHGGLSTGPRTPEGLARCGSARLRHGFRSRDFIALRGCAVHAARRLRSLTRALSAGHGVDRHNPQSSVGARCARAPSSPNSLSPASRLNDPRARAARAYTNQSNGGVSAGHGVDRSDSIEGRLAMTQSNHVAPTSACPRLRVASSSGGEASSAGRGVHRSFRDRLLSSAPLGGSGAVPRTLPSSAGHGLHRPDRADRQPLT